MLKEVGENYLTINLDALAIQVIVSTIIISPFLWLSGRALVGREKAKFTDAIWIVVLGTVIGTFFAQIFEIGIVALIIQVLLWLTIVKHFFDCGWIKAFAITIFAVIVFAIVGVILAFIGLVVWTII
ncbi:hypothetical protein KAS06_03475 [Candidatus Bathyarchaeota archaeon]|nr:hypothetical protein [Candidatus Bathyarchaeota archaeon]